MSERDRILWSTAERQCGVFSHAQAVDAGFSPAAVQRRVRNGSWRRERHAVYAAAGAPSTFESRVLAAVYDVGEAAASHRTAAALHGLDGFRPTGRIEVMLFDRRGIAIPGVVVHRPRVWLDEDAGQIGPIPVTSVTRTLFDLAAVARTRQIEIAFDDALRRGIVTLEAVAQRLDEVRRPGVRGLARMARLVAERSSNAIEESELESMFRRLLQKARLPKPVPQYEIRRDDGSLVARVDFAYPQFALAIELDSWTYHGGRVPFERDRIRQNDLVDLGWTLLRFTKADLRSRARRVVALVSRRVVGEPFGPR